MKVYVGTYRKYNEGSIKGAWLDLDAFRSYDEFIGAAKKLHRDEADPELMIQDVEHDGSDWQAGFTGELVSDYADYWTIKAEAEANGGEAKEPVATVTRNTEKNGIEIRFFERPAQGVIDDLKKNRWRWSRFSGCWYNRYCEETAKYAEKIAGGAMVANGDATAARPSEPKSRAIDPVRQEYREELKKVWPSNDKMVDFCDKEAAVIVKTSDGFLLPIEKGRIQTRHCEGEDDGRGRSMAAAEAGCRYFETEKGFKETNLKEFEDCEFYFDTDTHRKNARIMKRYGNDARIVCLVDIERSYCAGEVHPLYTGDIETIRAGYKEARTAFKKRLDSYWKRFGNTKLHTWTYWTEA